MAEPTTATTTAKREYTPQEAAQLGLGYVPSSHPSYGTAGFVGSEAPTSSTPSTTSPTTPSAGPLAPSPTLTATNAPQVGATPQQPNLSQTPSFVPEGVGAQTMNPLQGAVQKALMGMLASDPNNVSITDPSLAPQAAAYKTARTNAQTAERSALAERAAAQGLTDSGAMDTGLQDVYQAAGQDIAGFNAGLVGQELTARRAQLQQALGLAGQLGLADQENALRRELANMDAQLKTMGLGVQQEGYNLQRQLAGLDSQTKLQLAQLDAQLRREGYGTQERLAAMDAEVRKYGIDTQGDLGRLDAAIRQQLGLGQLGLGYASLGTQNQQFYDNLGFQIGAHQSDLDSQLYSQMLGSRP